MKILAIDIGVGTQDIMLYDSKHNIENAIKMVLPSPTKILANKIRKINQDIFLTGHTMGGGPITFAIREHLQKGYKVFTTPEAARTIKDNLQKVKNMGIKISKENPSNLKTIKLADVNIKALKSALSNLDINLEFDHLAIAVQDHGYSTKMGDRNFRFHKIKEKLKKPTPPEEFAYPDKIPEYFTRMNSIKKSLKKYKPLLMDSKFAAIAGTLQDPKIKKYNKLTVLDVGNGHTLAATIKNGKIMGLMEHHTKMLNPNKIEKLINKLVNGTLTHSQVHKDGGHGAHIIKAIKKFEKIVVTGPQRKLVDKTSLPVYHAAPAGDVMMTGPVGLINSVIYHRGKHP
ncbi:MAG TPA: DUF1786 family protein [Methanothermobacter sp.]|nr:conserved hypothetical protein [Methanothermobacter sp. MT-2]HHW05705.1 DUF1786 domain-containing protein [Methanothermobacter sp.]HOK72255.1 DUF1786 family protein [Methanothermobacter sp.]HOL68943.1 DUF1786 family protein [Methanothermobacter sp.]HPQ04918.1 DUF1786 family protein [Methanothermobacter sp.]